MERIFQFPSTMNEKVYWKVNFEKENINRKKIREEFFEKLKTCSLRFFNEWNSLNVNFETQIEQHTVGSCYKCWKNYNKVLMNYKTSQELIHNNVRKNYVLVWLSKIIINRCTFKYLNENGWQYCLK